MNADRHESASQGLTRREVLTMLGTGALGLAVAACTKSVSPTTTSMIGSTSTSAALNGSTTFAPAPDVTTLVLTGAGPDLTYGELVNEVAAARYPSIRIQYDETPFVLSWADYANTLITRLAAGDQFDIIYAPTEVIGLLASRGVLIDLQPLLDADESAASDVGSDFHPTLVAATQVDGKLAGIPYVWNCMLMHYNPTLLSDLGIPEPSSDWTWDDFLETTLAIKSEGSWGYSWWDEQFGMSPWYFNNGTSPLSEDWTQSNMDDPKVAETLQFLADLVLVHGVAPNPAGWDEWGQFHSGQQFSRGCGGWCINGAKNDGFTDFHFQLYPSNGSEVRTNLGVGAHGVAALASDPGAAFMGVLTVSSPEAIENATVVNGSPPARQSVASSDSWLRIAEPSTADMSIFYDALDVAQLVPSPANFNIVDPLLKRYYAGIWNGDVSVQDAVAGAHAELTTEMELLNQMS